MCGIAGFLSLDRNAQADPNLIDQMCRVIVHRGPDDQGVYVNGPIGLGMRRLSIIDVHGGHQPVHNEDRTVWVVFNGEIYNYPKLREDLLHFGHHFYTNSDTEVIVHLYEQYGEDFLAHINGMFAIALWDTQTQKLILARDRMGEKPLYYTQCGRQLIWGSEIKCLLVHPHVERRLSLPGLSRYLQLEYVPSPDTIFENIHKLPPAHMLIAERGTVRVIRYWKLALSTKHPVPSESEALEELDQRLAEAVRKRLVSDVPLGVFLSGGVDSSTVAAFAAQAITGKLQTFSIAFEDPSFDESSYARTVAHYLGTEHHEDTLSPSTLLDLVPHITEILDEPLGDASIIPTYLLSKFARKHVTVTLGGDGGDELFGGYPTYQAHRLAAAYDAIPARIRPILSKLGKGLTAYLPVSTNNISLDFKLKRFVAGLEQPGFERHFQWLGSFTPSEQHNLFTPEVRAALGNTDIFAQSRFFWEESSSWDSSARYFYLDSMTYLPDDILVKVDRASMAASLEVRAPLLDHTLVEYVAGLPTSHKLKGMTTKHLLKKVALRYLPSKIVKRPKKGFGIPVAKWFQGPLKSALMDVFSEDRIRKAGLFDVMAIRKLMDDHFRGYRDNRKPLWTLFMFEMWRSAYLLSPTPHFSRDANCLKVK